MAHQHTYIQSLAFAEEASPCVPPADWTAETSIEFISCDMSGVKETLIVDPTAERRTMRVTERARVAGVRNVTASVVCKLHGIGSVTADGAQAPDTYLARLLRHVMGQAIRGYSTTLTGGTPAIVIVDDATGIIPGVMLAFEDTTSPTSHNTGILHPRRVIEVDGLNITLSEVLPFTPAAGDKVHATITAAFDNDYLVDATAAGGTLCWYYKRETGNVATDLLWRLDGCVANAKIDGLSRDGLPTLNIDIMAANFLHGGVDGLTNAALAVPEGHAQMSVGAYTRMLISPSASNAIAEVDQSSLSLDMGVTRKPTLSHTTRIERFDGLSSYHYDPGMSTIEVQVHGYTDDWYAALQAGTTYRLTFYQPGDGSGAGKMVCIHAPKARLIETPARTDVGQVHGATLKFQCCEPDDCEVASNADLEQSRLLIALA